MAHMVVKVLALSGLAATLRTGSTSGQEVHGCQPGDPTGYFTGTATSQQSGPLEVSLNLRCADGRYDGELVTPLGTFAITGGRADANQIHLLFTAGPDLGTLDATLRADTVGARFAVSGDSGVIALRRVGETRPDGWDIPTLDLDAARWRHDLVFFAREIVARHRNAFHSLPRRRFDSLVTALDRRLDSLNSDQVYVEMDQIANLIGDAHTFIAMPDDSPQFPFQVRRFGTEYRVIAVLGSNERILGARLLTLEGRPIAMVMQRLLALTPASEHRSLRQARAERFLSMGMILHGLDITSTRDAVTLTLAGDAGQQLSFDAHAVPMNGADVRPWTQVFDSSPLYLQHPDQEFWSQYLPEARTVYCSFRSYGGLSTRAADLLALVERTRPDKLVIDMRQNGGGDYTLGLRYLVEPISRLSHLNRRGHLFVAIGTNTFSAGMANAAQFRTRTAAILVGQTIGEKPNSFQEAREIRLPNSHLRVRYSTQYYHFAVRGTNAVRPDHEIVATWADYRAGRDPVLEWILRYASTSGVGNHKKPPGDQESPPNMRLKLAGRDRLKGSGVFVPWRARTVVQLPWAGGRVARSLSAIR